MIVTMHFGDGTFKLIDMEDEYDIPEDALEAARDWVFDCAWFEIETETETEAGTRRQMFRRSVKTDTFLPNRSWTRLSRPC